IRYYAVLLPLAMVDELSIFVVPVNIVVCLAFNLISEAGRVLEDPFTMFWPALPLTNMSKTIEANLVDRLGDEEVPEIPGQDARGIMM
ncbi:MAG: hypothetical protein KJO07_24390, partial [Deltaproteobacteria bacterium]|nr:hypothetical protein [Deltaproteobacteria bacterium]